MYAEDEGHQQVQTANIMDQFGSDLAHAGGMSRERRREQCIKRGECPNCQRKTHKVSRFSLGKTKREPLNIEGEVVNGQCLRCMPLQVTPGTSKPAIPDTLEVPARYSPFSMEDDSMTVTSEITMDPYLTAPPVEGPNVSAPSGSRWHSSHATRPHLMASHFESVSEEAPMTDFGRRVGEVAEHITELENERREREGAIVREQESRVLRLRTSDRRRECGERTSESEEVATEESEEVWESHEHLLRNPEPAPQSQQDQQFHPLSIHHSSSTSEQSISLNGGRESPDSPRHRQGNTGHTNGSSQNQQFHPLSQVAHFQTSDRSISLNDTASHGAGSVQSSDSDRIIRLCQGSRSSLMMEVDKSPQKSVSPPQSKSPPFEREKRPDGSKEQMRPPFRKGGDRADTNRFSLRRLSSSNERDGEAVRAEMTRKKGVQKESNRFSLTRLDSQGRPQPSMPTNLMKELHASKNWDSNDILKDAAAEANGGDLDAAVDALFGAGKTGATFAQKGPATSGHSSSDDDTDSYSTSDDSSEDEQDLEDAIHIMASTLSRGSSALEAAALATTIRQRRISVSSSSEGRVQSTTNKDIPVIIEAVKSRPTDQKCTEKAFQSLFLLATDPEPEGSIARKEILANGGMETLISAIWDHMQTSQVLLALFHALWAIAVFNGKDEMSNAASASKIQQCRVLDGLLVAMQTHSEDLSIQESGCDLITRLSGLLPDNTPEFKSAVVLLSNNIQSFDTGTKAYTSCLDSLNSLCQLSDGNKLEFAKAGRDCHNAIIRGLSGSPDLETRELACQLFWCVTSDRTSVSALTSNGLLAKKIIDAMRSAQRSTASVHFYGAACGTLANLALEASNHSSMIDLGAVQALCEAIYKYEPAVDVLSPSCTALANLSASRNIRNDIVSHGGVSALFAAMRAATDNVDIQKEAFRALHNLCESSPDGKRAVVADLETIIATFFRYEGVKYIQQITCSLLFRVSTDERCRKKVTEMPRIFDALADIMKSNPRRKVVQKAACSALGNISLEESAMPILRNKRFDSLVIEAMDAHPDCEELQESACTFLMNMGSSSPEASVEICSGGGIQAIVKAMQTTPNSASLQEASCGALSAITKGDAHKNIAVSAGAIDAVIYLMLIHPEEGKVLEKAVKVLTNLSSLKRCTKTIADAGGISTVVETMRFNPNSSKLIQSGSRFIRNMALSDAEYANESLGGIIPILGCMDEHPDNARLVEEACKALRVLVLKSESCKDRVLTADGVAIIEKTMKANSASQRWQTLLLDELFQ